MNLCLGYRTPRPRLLLRFPFGLEKQISHRRPALTLSERDTGIADFNIEALETPVDCEHLPYWDVVIIGAGPAGLAASLTTAHRALTTLVIEAKDRPGGQPQFLYADKRIV